MNKKYRGILIIAIFSFFFAENVMADGFFGKLKYQTDSLITVFQNNRANKIYSSQAYIKAIDKYEKLLEKGYYSETLGRNLAFSYFRISNTEKSEYWFQYIIDQGNYNFKDILYYVNSLRYNKKYELADTWMYWYYEFNSDEIIAQNQKNITPKVNKILKYSKYNIQEVDFNSEYSDFGPTLFGDNIVFSTGRNDDLIIKREFAWKEAPYLDLFITDSIDEKSSTAMYFSNKINSIYHDGPACFNSSGDEIFFTRNNMFIVIPVKGNGGINNLKIFYAKKNKDDWSEVEEMPFNSRNYSCGHPSLSANDSLLYFASNMPGGYGETDIYSSIRTDTGWSEPVNLGSDINTEGEEMFPFIHKSGNLYFASNGHMGLGGLDIFIAKQTAPESYKVKNMGYPLNSSMDDFSFILKEDEINGYFASNRDGGTGDDDIYKVEILEGIELNKTIEIPNIYFDLGKWDIREDAAIELDKVVLFLEDNVDIKIELGAHTDSRGSSKFNQWLSQIRAQSSVNYIVERGINKDRITAKGYGESKLKNRCADGIKCSDEEHQENRRTEIRIVGI